jgi:hypothetical protein
MSPRSSSAAKASPFSEPPGTLPVFWVIVAVPPGPEAEP